MDTLVLIIIVLVILYYIGKRKEKNTSTSVDYKDDGNYVFFNSYSYKNLATFENGEIYSLNNGSKTLIGRYEMGDGPMHYVTNTDGLKIGNVYCKENDLDYVLLNAYNEALIKSRNESGRSMTAGEYMEQMGYVDGIHKLLYEKNGTFGSDNDAGGYKAISETDGNLPVAVGAGAAYIALVYNGTVSHPMSGFWNKR